MTERKNQPGASRFVIVISSYNNRRYYERNLSSALNQAYANFRILYTDDCSPDGTAQLAADWLAENDPENRVVLKRNDQRAGALQNIFAMINTCEDDEIIVTLDGDDWLAHSRVLEKLDQVYRAGEVWVTYGQYRTFPEGRNGICRQIPAPVIRDNKFRRSPWCSSHLRSFYTWIFKQIRQEDLMKDGKFYWMTWDMAIMMPIFEMAGVHQQFIPDILYIYNKETPLNDHKVDRPLQASLRDEIRAKPVYSRLEK